MEGKVYLVGCGPGAADLLTLRAVKILKKADVVLYDRLVDPKVLNYARKARKIPSGKLPGEQLKQGWINRVLYSWARKGKVVVRLKNGDPMVFGRGGEELEYLQNRGVKVEVIPGLSSAIAIPSLAKIPLTRRGVSSSLTILTGHRAEGRKQRWFWLGDTVVVLMAVKNLDIVSKELLRAGKSPFTPCAVVSEGSTEKEKVVVSTLSNIADISKRLRVKAPAVMIVGEVVNSLLDFRGKIVTAFRASHEIGRTKRLIKLAGAKPNVYEICETKPAEENLKRMASRKWDTLIFTSAAGVRAAAKFFKLKEHKLIAVGETTRRELEQHGCKHVLIPPIQNLDGIRKLLKEKKLGRVLAFRSPLAKEKLDGATNVIAYRVEPKNLDSTIRAYLKTKSDFTILTSSGLLECLLKAADRLGLKKRFVGKMNRSFVISLGSSITKFALENGINVCYEPQEPNLESLFHGD